MFTSNKIISRSQKSFKNDAHNALTEKVNKIALSSNGDKTEAFDGIALYTYSTNVGKVCKTELLQCLKI